MSNARVFWIVWCVLWAVFWLFIGGPLTMLVGWIMVPISLALMLLPIGTDSPTVVQQQVVVYPPPAPPQPGPQS